MISVWIHGRLIASQVVREPLRAIVRGKVQDFEPILHDEQDYDCCTHNEQGSARPVVDVDDKNDEDYHAQNVLLVDAREPDKQNAEVLKQAFQGSIHLDLAIHVEDGLELEKNLLFHFVTLLPIFKLVMNRCFIIFGLGESI